MRDNDKMRHPSRRLAPGSSPSPGLSASLFPNKNVEPYSPKGPENIKITVKFKVADL